MKELHKTLHTALLEVRRRVDAGTHSGYAGICHQLERYFLARDGRTTHPAIHELKELSTRWPKFSGDIEYPVPHPGYTHGYEAYVLVLSKWDGEYGANRRELLDWLIDTLEEELT